MEIKVLYFIPHLPAGSESSSLADLFLGHMAEEAEVHLATLTPTAPPSAAAYRIHCIGSGKPNYGKHGWAWLPSLQKRFLHLVYDLMPDIIHIHGSYSFLASRIAKWAYCRNFPFVFTPNGGMSPEYIDKAYGQRTWRMLTYQKKMSHRASCIITSDTKEAELIRAERLNDRVVLIDDPMAGEYLDMASLAGQITAIYRKVLASDMTARLHQNQREAVSALLHLSMAAESERQPLCSEDILNLRRITPPQWREIFLFAKEQGVTQHVTDGISRAQLTTIANTASSTPTFPPHSTKSTDRLEDRQLLITGWHAKIITKKLKATSPAVEKACIMLINIRQLLHTHALTLRPLCDLYETYRYEDIDEGELDKALHLIGIYPFACRISQILSETAYLDEGFMPVPALDDKGTAHLRSLLMKDPTL